MTDNSEQNSWGVGGTPILVHGREVPRWWPPFWGFSIRFGPYFIRQHNLIDPLFLQKKICLSLSHLVLEILGPKIGQIFHHNVLFNRYKAFCINFPIIFDPIDPHFSLILKLIDPSFSQSLRSDWVQFVFACWTWVQKIWWSTPPPRKLLVLGQPSTDSSTGMAFQVYGSCIHFHCPGTVSVF